MPRKQAPVTPNPKKKGGNKVEASKTIDFITPAVLEIDVNGRLALLGTQASQSIRELEEAKMEFSMLRSSLSTAERNAMLDKLEESAMAICDVCATHSAGWQQLATEYEKRQLEFESELEAFPTAKMSASDNTGRDKLMKSIAEMKKHHADSLQGVIYGHILYCTLHLLMFSYDAAGQHLDAIQDICTTNKMLPMARYQFAVSYYREQLNIIRNSPDVETRNKQIDDLYSKAHNALSAAGARTVSKEDKNALWAEVVELQKQQAAKNKKKKCDNCGAEAHKLMQCSRCQLARYCSKKCQQKHWKEHKATCDQYSAQVPENDVLLNCLSKLQI